MRTIENPTSRDVRRFWAKVMPEGECWLWTGATFRNGYGAFAKHNTAWYAHRFAYELVKGTVPDGLQIDHLCFVRRCVNPDHLEAVTAAVNVQRSVAHRGGSLLKGRHRVVCSNGHTRTPENTKVRGDGILECLDCRAAREVTRRLRRMARAA